jgi:hypothetical protein
MLPLDNFPSSQQLSVILRAIKKANEDYLEWSGSRELFVSYACESMVQVYIAKSLAKLSLYDVLLEVPIKQQKEKPSIESLFSPNTGKIEFKNIDRCNGIIDIVLLDKKTNMHNAIIEVKNDLDDILEGSEKDITRLCHILNEVRSVKYGYFTFFANTKTGDKMSEKLQKMFKKAELIVKSIRISDESIKIRISDESKLFEFKDSDNKSWQWATGCYMLTLFDGK